MEEKNRKNIYLSILLGLLIIVTVFGATYAFFTYSRVGGANNVLTAGRIVFRFDDGDTITLTNAFPIAGTTGVGLNVTDSTCTFTVTGNTPTGNVITYAVWAVPGDTSSQALLGNDYTNYTSKFQDSEIYTHIVKTSGGAEFTGLTDSTNGTAINSLPNEFTGVPVPTNGRLLGYGTITGTGSDVVGNFTVRMWIDESQVTVCGSGCTYTEGEYSHKYYTMKIVVTATDGEYTIQQQNNNDICPGCVYTYTTNTYYTTWNTQSQTPTVLTSNDYEENYQTVITNSGKNYFLGLKLNGSNQITNAYACGVKDNEPFCIEGTVDGSKYLDNQTLLQGANLWNNTCIVDGDLTNGYTQCGDFSGSLSADARPDGGVGIGVGIGGGCGVSSGGDFTCRGSSGVEPGGGDGPK